MHWIQTTARIVYSPVRADLKKKNRNPKWSVVADVDPEIGRMYRWWLKKQWWLDIDQPKWHPHVTVLDGRVPITYNDTWKMHHNKTINIEYSLNIEQHWKFFVLPVKCEVFDKIRYDCGLADSAPYHITIGRMK